MVARGVQLHGEQDQRLRRQRQRLLRRQDHRDRRQAVRNIADPLAAKDAIAVLPGVAAVDPQVQVLWNRDGSGANFSIPKMVIGLIPGADVGHGYKLELATGRALTADDTGDVVVLGADLAKEYAVVAGATVEIHGRPFQVLGTYLPTLTAPDTEAQVPLVTAQGLYLATLPPLVAEALVPSELANQIIVYPAEGADADTIASAIQAAVPNSATLTGTQFNVVIGSSTAIFNAIIIGVAVISLVVGGLSVINTMAMSVAERTREIGIKRAIGGARRRIIRELVLERRADWQPRLGACHGGARPPRRINGESGQTVRNSASIRPRRAICRQRPRT
jgi:hypothetical protein